MFRKSKLDKNEDPEIWHDKLENLQDKLNVLGSSMTDD
jgi:hypothetical protein